ncbi:Bug family tripartite tricarboxylate transporter substrate binding protein [Cupriavidus sp. PET2-C1]
MFLSDPSVHHVRVQPVAERHAGHRCPRLASLLQYHRLELGAVLSAAWPLDSCRHSIHRPHDPPSWGRCRIPWIDSRRKNWTLTNGLPGFEMIFWQALVAPAGTPKDITSKLNKAINEILVDPEIKRRLVEMDLEPAGGSQEALETLMRTQAGKWKKVVLDAGIKLD